MDAKNWDRFFDLVENLKSGRERVIYVDRYGALLIAVADEIKAAGLDEKGDENESSTD